MPKIRKALIPVAGFGTRMLPITKTVSKVMLPIVDKPVLQIVIEELVEAGIEEVIIAKSPRQNDVVDYCGEVEPHLAAQLRNGSPEKQAWLETLQNLSKLAKITFVTQEDTDVYGTGTPVLRAEPHLQDEPFIYTLADDFFVGPNNSYKQLIEVYERYNVPVVSCQPRTADSDYDRYGYVGGTELQTGEIDMTTIIEHPGKANKPSDFASLGGYVVTPEVWPYLKKARDTLPEGKEFYFHSSFSLMMADGHRVIAREIKDAQYYDTGNKLEYMKTSVAMAAIHPEIGERFQQFLKEFINKEGNQ